MVVKGPMVMDYLWLRLWILDDDKENQKKGLLKVKSESSNPIKKDLEVFF